MEFTVADATALPDLANLQIGLPPPPGQTNSRPEIRRYSLLKVSYLNELKLYFRLTDTSGYTLRVFPLARMLSFSEPDAQIDRSNNLHVLFQVGARSFGYWTIAPKAACWSARRMITRKRAPKLRVGDDGQVIVAGGVRLIIGSDEPGAGATEPIETARSYPAGASGRCSQWRCTIFSAASATVGNTMS